MKIELIIVIIAAVGIGVCVVFAVINLVKMSKTAKEIKKLSEEIERIDASLKTLSEKVLTFGK
jgi:outer membrane murein-binding lipoprotein Lpp